MAPQPFTVAQAARRIGVTRSTLLTLIRSGRARAERDDRGRTFLPAEEVYRLTLANQPRGDGNNRFRAIVTELNVEGLMGQVEMVVSDPVRLVAVISADAARELGLALRRGCASPLWLG
jgi:excisionase family DNA binding protein